MFFAGAQIVKQPIFWVLIFPLITLVISCNNPVQTKTPTVSIHLAAWGGDLEAVKQHLAAGTDVDAKNQWRATPLLKAAREGHKAISELLINNGADLNAKNVDGKTPLDYAIENNHTNIADLLRQHGGKTGKELEAEKRHIGWQRSR
ncbi:TPA: ankyrin repeat domain-containing protein [Candidatus Poribacteria bacterium]|nr:ankyrin repeat domain-containing protein [Candidatus Poribacteria bacterium]